MDIYTNGTDNVGQTPVKHYLNTAHTFNKNALWILLFAIHNIGETISDKEIESEQTRKLMMVVLAVSIYF